jgi:hypothetical protein
VAQKNKAVGFNVTSITIVDLIDLELLENILDMEEIDAKSVDDITDESVMIFFESTQDRDASVTAEFVEAKVLATVSFTVSEKDPALRVTKTVSDYYPLHRNLRLDFIDGKQVKAVEHLFSVIKPASLKVLIERKLKMDKFDLKKNFLEFVAYLEKMAIIHDEHCHVVQHKETVDSGYFCQCSSCQSMKNTGKSSDAGSRSSGHNSGGDTSEGGTNIASDRDRTNFGHGRSKDTTGTGKQSAWEPAPYLNTEKCAGEKHYLFDCLHTEKVEAISLIS